MSGGNFMLYFLASIFELLTELKFKLNFTVEVLTVRGNGSVCVCVDEKKR